MENTLGYRMNGTMYNGQWNPGLSDFAEYKTNAYESARDTPTYRSTSRSQNPPYARSGAPTSPFNAPSLGNGLVGVDASFQQQQQQHQQQQHQQHQQQQQQYHHQNQNQNYHYHHNGQYTQSPPPLLYGGWQPPVTSSSSAAAAAAAGVTVSQPPPPSYGPIGSSVRPSYTTTNTGTSTSTTASSTSNSVAAAALHAPFSPIMMDDDIGGGGGGGGGGSSSSRTLLAHPVSPPNNNNNNNNNNNGGGGGISIGSLGLARHSFSPVGSGDDLRGDGSLSLHSDDSSGQDQTVPSPPSLSMSLSSTEKGGTFHSNLEYMTQNGSMLPAGNGNGGGNNGLGRSDGRNRPGRRGANRDEFDGPHQFLPRPTPSYVAMQERELPHLPTNLLVQEQDAVLSQVNDRLSQCAYDFVARYQFPVPLTQDMRPVARPQDREWTEWVQLLKRLATKRRIPARVLYNGQIKQFVTILENSLEMRHAARHQSRPLKDDRNILQLISAGIQVAKILKDAPAMDFLDRLYVATEQQIQERSSSAAARFRGGM